MSERCDTMKRDERDNSTVIKRRCPMTVRGSDSLHRVALVTGSKRPESSDDDDRER